MPRQIAAWLGDNHSKKILVTEPRGVIAVCLGKTEDADEPGEGEDQNKSYSAPQSIENMHDPEGGDADVAQQGRQEVP
jgi:hypothetical protein